MSRLHLDLFSGIGGFAIAAQACGYKTIGFCEREPYAQQILKERFGAVLADTESNHARQPQIESADSERAHSPGERGELRNKSGGFGVPRLHDNIFTLNGADYAGVDLLTGGFPCQPFSVAGKRRGAEDDRAIWPQMLRVIREAKPTWIIGENVAGIVTMELDNILSDLESLGYSAWPLVIPACAVDARHRRDRVWIVAHAGHLCGRGRAESATEERAETSNNGAKLADSEGAGLERRKQHGTKLESELGLGQGGITSEAMANTLRCGRPGQGQSINAEYSAAARDGQAAKPGDGGRPAQWLPEPELGRVAHGIPHRAHRLRGLGNAIVPQVAEEIIRAITNLI
jgi:DNA (cytosine-5)-methyltransferase 1